VTIHTLDEGLLSDVKGKESYSEWKRSLTQEDIDQFEVIWEEICLKMKILFSIFMQLIF
jgi:hypothetical protein